MPTSFLIEFRLQGYAKQYAKWARARVRREAKRLRIRELRQPRFVPYITLYGPAKINNLQGVIRELAKTGQQYTLVPFKLGVRRGKFQNSDANWLYLDVRPSPELEKLRFELAQSLYRLDRTISVTCQPYDKNPEYEFHVSIWKGDPKDSVKFEKLFEYAENRCGLEDFRQDKASAFRKLLNVVKEYFFGAQSDDPSINLHLLRVTVLRGRRIYSEFDLVLNKILNRQQALDRLWNRISIAKLQMLLRRAQNIFLISDTHFNHRNIINYCCRPFSNVRQMNRVMEKKWNSTIGVKDSVYFLGDLSFRGKARYWARRLNGYMFPIRGNHDRDKFSGEFFRYELLSANGHTFLLVHDPEDEEVLRNGIGKYDWIIHGHVHNNQMERYPFINGERKTINVSVELLDYRPVNLKYLLSLDLNSIRRMQTINSRPERW